MFAWLLFVLGCGGIECQKYGEDENGATICIEEGTTTSRDDRATETTPDADADTDSDSDTDADADSDADSDTDTHSETGTSSMTGDTGTATGGGTEIPINDTSYTGDTGFIGWVDNDGDGWHWMIDCVDSNPLIYPGRFEHMYNGLDDDCDPATLDAPYADPLCVEVMASVTGTVSLYIFETSTNDTSMWIHATAEPVVPNGLPFATGDASVPICGDLSRLLVPYATGDVVYVYGAYLDSYGVEQSLVTGDSGAGYTSHILNVTMLSPSQPVCVSFFSTTPQVAPNAYDSCTMP